MEVATAAMTAHVRCAAGHPAQLGDSPGHQLTARRSRPAAAPVVPQTAAPRAPRPATQRPPPRPAWREGRPPCCVIVWLFQQLLVGSLLLNGYRAHRLPAGSSSTLGRGARCAKPPCRNVFSTPGDRETESHALVTALDYVFVPRRLQDSHPAMMVRSRPRRVSPETNGR